MERLRVQSALSDLEEVGREDRTAANEPGEMYDSAEPLTKEGVDDSVRAELRERLAAIDRAEERLAAGTYGYSIRSGDVIPDDSPRSRSRCGTHYSRRLGKPPELPWALVAMS